MKLYKQQIDFQCHQLLVTYTWNYLSSSLDSPEENEVNIISITDLKHNDLMPAFNRLQIMAKDYCPFEYLYDNLSFHNKDLY
jgi:hypothetical protein